MPALDWNTASLDDAIDHIATRAVISRRVGGLVKSAALPAQVQKMLDAVSGYIAKDPDAAIALGLTGVGGIAGAVSNKKRRMSGLLRGLLAGGALGGGYYGLSRAVGGMNPFALPEDKSKFRPSTVWESLKGLVTGAPRRPDPTEQTRAAGESMEGGARTGVPFLDRPIGTTWNVAKNLGGGLDDTLFTLAAIPPAVKSYWAMRPNDWRMLQLGAGSKDAPTLFPSIKPEILRALTREGPAKAVAEQSFPGFLPRGGRFDWFWRSRPTRLAFENPGSPAVGGAPAGPGMPAILPKAAVDPYKYWLNVFPAEARQIRELGTSEYLARPEHKGLIRGAWASHGGLGGISTGLTGMGASLGGAMIANKAVPYLQQKIIDAIMQE